MTAEELKNAFSELSEERQALVLAAYLHQLTILARDSYEVGTDRLRDPLLLRRLNELQHKVSSAIVSRLRKSMDRYPDDALIDIIAGGDEAFNKRLRFCFGEALRVLLKEKIPQ